MDCIKISQIKGFCQRRLKSSLVDSVKVCMAERSAECHERLPNAVQRFCDELSSKISTLYFKNHGNQDRSVIMNATLVNLLKKKWISYNPQGIQHNKNQCQDLSLQNVQYFKSSSRRKREAYIFIR